MIKTLRVTSILAAVAAVVLLVLPVVYGVGENTAVEELVKSPGAVERFKSAEGQREQRATDQESPLVKQANAFALYLNPPAPVARSLPARPSSPTRIRSEIPAPTVAVSAKFDLLATSVFASRPELSLILIDEPAKGVHWVRQGEAIGHLIVKEVKSGSVVIEDGQRTFDMTVERTPTVSIEKDPSGADKWKVSFPASSGGGAESGRITPVPMPTTTPRRSTRVPVSRTRGTTRITRTSPAAAEATSANPSQSPADRKAAVEELLRQQRERGSDDTSQLVEELLSQMSSESALSPEETAELEKLGQALEEPDVSEPPPRPPD